MIVRFEWTGDDTGRYVRARIRYHGPPMVIDTQLDGANVMWPEWRFDLTGQWMRSKRAAMRQALSLLVETYPNMGE